MALLLPERTELLKRKTKPYPPLLRTRLIAPKLPLRGLVVALADLFRRLAQLQSVSPYVLLNASGKALDGAAVVVAGA